MKKNEFKVLISIIALILSLTAFLAAYHFYKEWSIKKPLINQIHAVGLVQDVNIEEKNKKYEIKISLKKSSDIQKSYIEIVKKIEEKLPAEDYRIIVKDQRNPNLEDIFKKLQPAIYEALANNKFIWLDEEIARQADKMSMKHMIFIDKEHLYLQIEDGNYYLYEIFDRGQKE